MYILFSLDSVSSIMYALCTTSVHWGGWKSTRDS